MFIILQNVELQTCLPHPASSQQKEGQGYGPLQAAYLRTELNFLLICFAFCNFVFLIFKLALCLWTRPLWFVQLLTLTMQWQWRRDITYPTKKQWQRQRHILWPSLSHYIVYEVCNSDLLNSWHRGFVFRVLCIPPLHHSSAMTLNIARIANAVPVTL